MLNQIVLVGRITSELKKINEKKTKMIIACNRNYKNEDGVYETDFIPIILGGNVAKQVTAWCEKGDLIGIRGRIEINDKNETEIIADKISFLSANKESEEEE